MVQENERGVIAKSYQELQGLHILKRAREQYLFPKASAESTLRTVFQSVEIALLNLSDLTKRATADIDNGKFHSAMVKMSWSLGFHEILSKMGIITHKLAMTWENGNYKGSLCINQSNGFKEFVDTLKSFDISVSNQFQSGNLKIREILAEQTLDNTELHLIHLIRVCNHEATIWEQNLTAICIPTNVTSYEEFIVTNILHEAVYDTVLKGDTFFTQFRALHQIPELLGEEINDHLENAIHCIRSSSLQQAVECLNRVNILWEGILVTLLPMVNNLVTSDYHRIRENLGLTSGSHSICLHYHMFRDLYEQLCKELNNYVVTYQLQESLPNIEEAIRRIDRQRFDNVQCWMAHLLFNECLKLRKFIDQWRELHFHLPRNELGSSAVKSLTGAPDAINKVKQMRDSARKHDLMQPLMKARGLKSQTEDLLLTDYLKTNSSIDQQILRATGEITKNRFKSVQERLGIFSNQCPFSPPPPRTV